MSKLADELWRKSNGPHFTKSEFIAALHEYGYEVRRRSAEICREKFSDSGWNSHFQCAANSCAAAIEQEKLP